MLFSRVNRKPIIEEGAVNGKRSAVGSEPLTVYRLAFSVYSGERGYKALSEMQAALPGRKGILSPLPRAVQLESGKLRKSRLPRRDNTSSRSDDPVLAVSLSRRFLPVNYELIRRSLPVMFPGFSTPKIPRRVGATSHSDPSLLS